MSKVKLNCSVITIGDELLIGQVIDTNSAWIAQELNKEGIWMKRRVAVGDSRDDIRAALDQESLESDIIIMTGGLGPTADDVTKPLLSEYFGSKLVVNEDVLNHVKFLFEKVFNRPMIERNLRQAEVPENCEVLFNRRGTAPGMWFEKDGKVFISLPGVPHEMKGLMTDTVIPKLVARFVPNKIEHRTLLTAGIGESFLAEHIKGFEENLPSNINLAYLPNYGMVRLRLTFTASDEANKNGGIDTYFNELKELVKEWMVVDEDLSIPQVVGRILKSRKQFVGTAESCTGGYIAHLLTREAGASDNFKGTVVSYSNETKENVLEVNPDTIKKHGAVSEETVTEMAKGALKVLKTDFALATSGIMGPDGGSEQKPVGTVWVAVADKDRVVAQLFRFRFDRMRNIELTATNALNLLRKFILETKN